MADSIRAVSAVAGLAAPRVDPAPTINAPGLVDGPAYVGQAGPAGKGFMDVLTDAIGDARKLEQQNQDMGERFAAGDPAVGIHEVMISAEKASISLRFAVTLKNRALEAYRELMSTQI